MAGSLYSQTVRPQTANTTDHHRLRALLFTGGEDTSIDAELRRFEETRRSIWSAPAERSGDGALDVGQTSVCLSWTRSDLLEFAVDPKRRRRFALAGALQI